MQAVSGADVMMGNDPDCLRWIKKYREPVQDSETGSPRERGRNRRRRSVRRQAQNITVAVCAVLSPLRLKASCVKCSFAIAHNVGEAVVTSGQQLQHQ